MLLGWLYLWVVLSFAPFLRSPSEGEEVFFVERKPLVPQLFPSFELTRETDVQNMAGAIQATLDEAAGLPIVDVKCLRLSARSKLLCLEP